jgi:capsid assembly protease
MKYPQIVSAFARSPWAILPEKLAEIRAFLCLKAGGGDIDPAEIAAIASARANGPAMVGRVACVQVFGTICQRAGMLDEASGGVGTEALGNTLDALAADRACRAVCMVFDSPGGSVFGVGELADKIRSLAGQKKIVAIADSMCASAAYWMAAQCREVYCTPGGQVGSIGVLAAHTDVSKMEEQAGVKTTLISAGKYKSELAEQMPLDEAGREELQSKVDGYYEAFLAAVAAGRGTTAARVKADFGQGRLLTAKQAKQCGAIDGIKTLQQVLESLGAYEGNSGMRAAVRARALEVALPGGFLGGVREVMRPPVGKPSARVGRRIFCGSEDQARDERGRFASEEGGETSQQIEDRHEFQMAELNEKHEKEDADLLAKHDEEYGRILDARDKADDISPPDAAEETRREQEDAEILVKQQAERDESDEQQAAEVEQMEERHEAEREKAEERWDAQRQALFDRHARELLEMDKRHGRAGTSWKPKVRARHATEWKDLRARHRFESAMQRRIQLGREER